MSRSLAIRRLHLSARAVPTNAVESRLPPSAVEFEPCELAEELVKAFAEERAKYLKTVGTKDEKLDPSQPPPQWFIDALLDKPAQDVNFDDLDRLARIDPKQSAQRWETVTQAAQRQLESGWRAARALEYVGGNAWERACFLTLRRGLCVAFPPRNSAEKLLIDEIAQYEILRQKWVEVVAMHSRLPASGTRQYGADDGESRKLTAVEATEEAIQMVDRLQRLSQNAVRMLLKCRGEKPAKDAARVDWFQALVASQTNA